MMRTALTLWPAILTAVLCPSIGAQIPAFPGAEGAGAEASGGRGGTVYRVTNLNSSGPGSFADAVSQPNRIIVFTTSGIIDLGGKTFKAIADNLTIAGQTAPGEGICFKAGAISVRSNNVILTHLRFRRGFIQDGDMGDSVAADPDVTTTNILFAHLSASWATDENMTMSKPNFSTVQYCIASEGLDYTNALQTPPNHSEGSLWGTTGTNGRVSMHHVLYAHNRLRNPRTTAFNNTVLADAPINDFRNSVIYDWKERASHTGNQLVRMNWINNYYKAGPSTFTSVTNAIFNMENNAGNKLHLDGNFLYGSAAKTSNNWQAVTYENGIIEANVRTNTPFIVTPVTTESAWEAYSNVLETAGATLPARDSVDLRIVNDVISGTGRVPDKETDLPPEQRWPDYRSLPAPLDTDADGMPDYWERQFGLNTNSPADNMTLTPSGYANIEHYLNNTHPTNGTTPIAFIYAAVSRCRAGASPGEWWVARSGNTNDALTVNYTVGGDAIAGSNYTTLPGSITIPAGATKTKLFLNPSIVTTDKVVVVTLQTGNSNYFVGGPISSLVVIRPAGDTDGDGLPDEWETNYFGSLTNANANIDSDGDSFTNLQEYQTGTNPTNALDRLKILSGNPVGNDIVVLFASAAGRRYSLESRDDLSGGTWTPAVTNIGGVAGATAVTDIGGATANGRFYRVRFTP
jgi:hypothetical protein